MTGDIEPLPAADRSTGPARDRARPSTATQGRNDTGIPDRLKRGLEQLSGLDLSDVRVHRNSSRPAAVGALGYTRGRDIYLGPGQGRHLAHEGWHAVQQLQGRVRPTAHQAGVAINDDPKLEHEADVMGARAAKLLMPPSRSTHRAPRQAAPHPTVQRLPNKDQLYWDRLREMVTAGGALFTPANVVAYAAANQTHVGPAIAAAIAAAAAANPAITLGGLRAMLFGPGGMGSGGGFIGAQHAATGQYAGDTVHNAHLTAVLLANPIVLGLTTGAVQSNVPNRRGAAPLPGGAIPLPAGADDRVVETADLFGLITNFAHWPGAALPPIAINRIIGPHARMQNNGTLDLGWAAARGTILHEFGHHVENNLGPADFATLHNFLTARVAMGPLPPGPMAGMRAQVGYPFEHHPGYDIDMPAIDAGGRRAGLAGYLGLVGSGLWQQLTRFAGLVSGSRRPRNHGGRGVEDFFVQNANNPELSYSSAVHRFNAAGYTGSTEYLSTTLEFLSRPDHAAELVNQDPLRMALLLYLVNRPVFHLVEAAYDVPPHAPPTLRQLIHTID